MAEREQSIHLYLGDNYTAGLRPSAEAGAYNSDDTVRPIFKWVTGGTQHDMFTLPAPIVANEWGLEHVLPRVMDTATLNFAYPFTQANVKVAVSGAKISHLHDGPVFSEVETAMERVAVEPIFANMTSGQLFQINGQDSFVGTPAEVVQHGIRLGKGLESEGFVIRIIPTHNFSDARNDLILELDASNRIRLPLTSGENALAVTVGGSTDTSATFQSAAAEHLYITVDWRRKRASVSQVLTGQEFVSMDLTNGDWAGLEEEDATFGVYDGTVYAPEGRPDYAAPRADLCVIQMGQGIGAGASAREEANSWVNAINSLRSNPWGHGMPVWLVLPPEDVPTTGSALRARAGMLIAAAELQGVFVIETRHLTRVNVSGDEVLNGSGLISLSESLIRDWRQIVSSNRRYQGRPRHTGFRRFENEDDADEFIETLVDAGLTTRDVSPHMGGPGERSGDGVDGSWPLAQTTRKAGDSYLDPNTGERLVPIDLKAARAGFRAPPRGIRIIPSDAGVDFIAAQTGPTEGAPLINFRDLTCSRSSKGNSYSLRTKRMRYIDGDIARLVSSSYDPDDTYTAVTAAATVTTGEDDPSGQTNAVLIEDTSGSVRAEVRTTGSVTVAISDPVWCVAWVKRDVSATTFVSAFARESSSPVAGVHVDQATGEISAFGSAQDAYIGRHGEWFYVTWRYIAGATSIELGFNPAAGTSFPTQSNSAQGSATVYGPGVGNTNPLGDWVGNITPYAYYLQPRWNRDDTLTTEGQRTNYLDNSIDLDWSKTNVTVERGERGPDGSPNSWVITDESASAGWAHDTTPGTVPSGRVALSFFLRKDTAATNLAGFRYAQGADTIKGTVSLADGSVTTFDAGGSAAEEWTASDEIVGPNGEAWFWVRVGLSVTVTSTVNLRLQPAMATTAGVENTAATGSAEFFGPQIESGEFASTYIETSGSTETRDSDDVEFSNSDMAASFYTSGFKMSYWPEHDSGSDGNSSPVQIFTFATSNYFLQLDTSTASESSAGFRSGGSTVTVAGISFVAGDEVTFSVDYSGDMVVSVNGVVQATVDISGESDWSGVSGVAGYIGSDGSGSETAYGTLSQPTSI